MIVGRQLGGEVGLEFGWKCTFAFVELRLESAVAGVPTTFKRVATLSAYLTVCRESYLEVNQTFLARGTLRSSPQRKYISVRTSSPHGKCGCVACVSTSISFTDLRGGLALCGSL